MYLVSKQGDVWSVKKNKILKQSVNRSGYYFVCLLNKDEGKYKSYLVHRLVATAFIPNPDNKETVNHKNFNKCDNAVENLEWMSRTENTKHAWENGGMPNHLYKEYNYAIWWLVDREGMLMHPDWSDFEKRWGETREQVLSKWAPAMLEDDYPGYLYLLNNGEN